MRNIQVLELQNEFQRLHKISYEDRSGLGVLINDKIRVKEYCEQKLPASVVDELFSHRIYGGYSPKGALASIKPPCVVRLNNGWHKMKFIFDNEDIKKVDLNLLHEWQKTNMYDPEGWKKREDAQWNKVKMLDFEKPERLETMIKIAEALYDAQYKFMRVDLYCNDNELRFSEMMQYHAGGTNGFGEFDKVLGAEL